MATTPFALVTALVAVLLSPAAARADAGILLQIEPCVRTQGYWSTRPGEWPASSLILGNPANPNHRYSSAELRSLLDTPARGDASRILAVQLIAAKFNVLAGARPDPILTELARADQLLGGFPGKLPYRVSPNSPLGTDMVTVARVLEAYNRGEIPGACAPVNRAPTANAGPDQTVPLGATVTLDGTGSSDPDGQALTYRWTFVRVPVGSAAALADATTARPTFVADVPGAYEARLIVNDGALDSAPDTVVVSTLNSAPRANAGPDQTALVGATVQLSGAGSTDPDGDVLQYAWRFVSGPAGSVATLANPTTVSPSFVVDRPGTYVVELVVSDGTLASDPDTVSVSTENSPPVARAGADTSGVVGQRIVLDGSSSTDADGNPLTYRWSFTSRPDGSQAALDDAASAMPAFTIDVFGDYVVQLIVNDGTVDSAADTVVVSTDNTPPVANAGPAQSVAVGAAVTLDGSGSTDADGHLLSYRWSLIAGPAGSTAQLSDPAAVRPVFTVDRPGTYVAQLVVNDGFADSAPSTVSVTTTNTAPVARAGADATGRVGQSLSLDGSASSDADGDPLTYRWSFTSRPSGSAAELENPTSPTPSFTIDVFGQYILQLVVNDGTVDSAPDTVTVNTENSPPVARAGDDQAVATGATVTLDGAGSTDVDGQALTYHWSLVSVPDGSAAALSDAAAVRPTFVVDLAGTYVAQLVVNDGLVDSAPSTVTITAAAVNRPPVAEAGPNQTVSPGATVQLDGSASSDPDGQALAYFWSLSRPATSAAALSDPALVNPAFVADVPGTYVAQLIVNDGVVDSAADTVTISTTNTVPVANAGPDQRVATGSVVTLDGSASSDADGSPLTYAWSLLNQPAGSTASLSDAASVSPTFTADVAGDYVVQLIVNDGLVDSPPDTVVITAAQGSDSRVVVYSVNPEPAPGQSIQVAFQVFNDGPAPATDLRLRVQIPGGYTLNWAAPSRGDFEQATGIWTIPGQGSAPSALTLALVVPLTGPYGITLEIIESSQPDPNSSNNRVTAVESPNVNADLRLSFVYAPSGTVQPGPIVGGWGGIWMQVQNFGPAIANGVVLTFVPPPGYTITGSNLGVGVYPGDYHPSTGIWNVGSLNQYAVGTLFLTGILNPTGSTALSASVTASSPDPDLSNNAATFPALNRPPVPSAGADRTVPVHVPNSPVVMNGTATDPEGDALTYQWQFMMRPMNSQATLAGAETLTPSFVADERGTYRLRLTASDGQGGTASSEVTVTGELTNSPPVIRSPAVTIGAVGAPYQYGVYATDPDAGDALTFALPTSPAGMTIDPATGVITWLPGAAQAGPQAVEVRVTDAGGLFTTQAFAVQVSSPGNGAPRATDDAYEVRLGESLGVGTPGVLQNDTDESPLTARLLTRPANGALLFNPDGSFTYTPDTQRQGSIFETGRLNLAARLPGVVSVIHSEGGCGSCVVDENPQTFTGLSEAPIDVLLPQDATVDEIQVDASLTFPDSTVQSGTVMLYNAAGAVLYDSGHIELPAPERHLRLRLPQPMPGVRRVTFSRTAPYLAYLSEFRIMGTTTVTWSPPAESNLVQRMAATIRTSSNYGFRAPEALIDDTNESWYAASGAAGEWLELTFPAAVTVREIQAPNAFGTPEGFNSSNGYDCSGRFTLSAADGTLLFDSGIVPEPSGSVYGDPYSLAVPDVAGVHVLRYTSNGCTGWGLGFSEIRVFGEMSTTEPAWGIGRRMQALVRREVHSTPIVVNLTDDNLDGRIDTNDVPDLVVPVENGTSQLVGDLKAVSGDDGRELFTTGVGLVTPWSEVAAGDLDGDGRPEIVAIRGDGTGVMAFDHTGAERWTSDAAPMPRYPLGPGVTTGAVSIANLDASGPPEIIVGATVFDASGRLLGQGQTLGGTIGGAGMRGAFSVVADIDLDGVPELVAGPTAYRLVNGQLSIVWQRTDRPDGFAAVGNFDEDPQAEIVIVASGTVYMLNHDGTDAEVWNAPSHAPVPLPGGGLGGAPLVTDVNGDGRAEIGVAGAARYVLFNAAGSVRWSKAVSDRSSNSTGSVAFDLDGDGAVEIIYRDEHFLRILRGDDGLLLAKMAVGSATWTEMPTVADVDNDGHADIVVSSDLFATNLDDTGLIVVTDAANRWRRTRRIWNQHAYHVTNVNEDASIPVHATPHWLIPGLNGFRTNAFVPGESPDEGDAFTYVASDGVLESNIATVRIAVRPVNAPPRIVSTAAARAARGVSYLYAARAVDPDAGDILTWSLPTAPAGMTIDAATGLVRWAPSASQSGVHDVVVRVRDIRGLFALQAFSIDVGDPVAVPDVVGQPRAAAEGAITAATLAVGAVSERHSPTVAAGAVISQTPVGGTFVAAGAAVGLSVSRGPAPSGTVPDVVGMTQAAATADIVAAQFALGTVGQYYTATVPRGIVLSQTPAAGTIADLGTAIAIGVSAGPPPGTLDVDGDGYTGDQGDCDDTDASRHPGAFDIPGDGIDQNCNGADSVAGDDTAPTALLLTPDDLAEVTMPTDVVGTVADANFLRYTVQLAEVDATTFTVIGSGSSPVTGGVVGRLDPTQLENGLYRVRLIAEDVNGQTAVDERVYRVTGEMKVGTFGLSFVDLRVPVQGIPITVVRSYDSRVKSGRDFGIGWQLQLAAGKLRHNRPPGEGWRIQDRPFLGDVLPCLGGSLETRSHLTEVRLSDREAYTFALEVNNGNVGITGACEGVASFRFLSGTLPGATLDILDGTAVIYLRAGPDRLLDMDAFLDGVEQVYEPRRVRLTTIDGRRIELDLASGITRIEDNNANALSITPAGILHSTGRSIAFTRDAQGRITRITDPTGRVLDYAYTGGDLTAFTDQTGHVTTFTYDDRHHLLEVRDPLGNRAVLTEYDAEGRLVAMTDARGHRTVFAHDVTGREEVVTDALGRPTRFVYDERGHVLVQEQNVTIDGVTVVARTTREYDAAGHETVVVDPDGMRVEATYANENLLEDVVDPAGLALRTTRTYDTRGEVLTASDPSGRTMAFAYDGRGNLTSLADGSGSATTIANDEAGRPLTAVDATGGRKRLAYDTSGRVIREEQLDASGTVLTHLEFTHDANGNVLTSTERRTVNGVLTLLTTRHTYDALNRLVATTDPLGGVTRTEYNALGRQSATVDALGRRTAYTYDEVGAPVRTDFPDGTFETLTYDALGNVATATDRGGRTTSYEYDELRRRVRVLRPDGTATQTIYSPGGRVVATIDARGHRTDHEFDSAGRRTRTRLPAVRNAVTGIVERPVMGYEYDAAGRITAVVDANGRRTAFDYDAAGRLVQRTFADGTTRQQGYDAAGRMVEQRDEAGRLTRFAYDTLGHLRTVTDALGGLTHYSYDEAGQLVAQTDALGRTTRYQRDALGRTVVRRLPGGGVETFSYDAVSRLVAETDFTVSTVLFEYDAADRLVAKDYPDGERVTFTYTPTGRRATATDARGTTTWAYDVNDQLIRVTQPGGEVLQYSYNADRQMQRLETPSATIDYERDALGRVVAVDAVVAGAPIGQSRYGYDPAGNIVEQTRPNGVATQLVYDVRNRLTSLSHLTGTTPIASFGYELSPTGRRTRVTELGGGVVTYGYDALDRLISEVRDGSLAVAYEYDAVGNRTRMVRDGTATGYAYDVDDRLLTAGAAAFTYDANGNVRSRTLGGATTTYDWDADGRLVRASGPGGATDFTYDVDGNRVARSAGGDVTRFLVDTNNPTGLSQVVEERGAAGDLRAQYTYGVSRLAGTRGGASAFYQADALGSTRLLTDATGAVTDQYTYDAFGILTAQTGATTNPYLFAGEQFEPVLGQYHLRARHYDPAVGRFTSRDPVLGNAVDPRSQHPFVYAHGDPVNRTDPTGLYTLLEIAEAIGIQNTLRAVDLGKRAVNACMLTGKIEIAQEALFWGQFAVAGPLIAAELAGTNTANTKTEIAIAAKRYINVAKSPEKVVEANAAIEFARDGGKNISMELTREDGFKFGGTLDLNEPLKSTFDAGVGPVKVSTGIGGPEIGVEWSKEFFKVQRCGIEMVTGSLKLSGKLALEPQVQAAIVLEGLAGLVKFTYPMIPSHFNDWLFK